MKRGIHPDNWFTASDFTPEGRTLVIERVEPVEVDPNKIKLVVKFKNEAKGLMLNETVTATIAQNIGIPKDRCDEWKGYKITPYSTNILWRSEITPCIRVKFNVGKKAEHENDR